SDMSDISENDEKLVKVDDWKAEMKKRINENKIYDVRFIPPEDGSVNIDKFIEFHKTLEDHLNYQPIKWNLTLLDNLLDLHPPDKALEKFKIYLETQEEDKKASDLSKKDMAQILKEHNLREAFFRITKLTKTDLCDKDISSIIEEFVKK
ncbi:13201_t:CDS:2, partial [Gigaspora rosea]